MDCSTKAASPDKHRSALGVFGVFEGRKLTAAADQLDRAANGVLRSVLGRGDLDGRSGTQRMLYSVAGFERVLLVGLGKSETFGAREYKDALTAALKTAVDTGAASAALFTIDWPVIRRAARWKARHAAMAAHEAAYRFEAMKSKKSPERAFKAIEVITGNKSNLADATRG